MKTTDDIHALRGYHFIGGFLKHGPALCAVYFPTVNSYKRLVRQSNMTYFSWAPVFNSFGSNNRTNAIRVPMNGGRCESRNAATAGSSFYPPESRRGGQGLRRRSLRRTGAGSRIARRIHPLQEPGMRSLSP